MDLEATLAPAVRAAREAATTDREREVLAELEGVIAGIDEVPEDEREDKIKEALEKLEDLLKLNPQALAPVSKGSKPAKRSSGAARSKRGGRVEAAEALPSTPLASLAGIGPKTAERLASRGLVTVEDALLFLPRRYDDRRSFTRIRDLVAGVRASVAGKVTKTGVRFAGRRVFEVVVEEELAPDAPPPARLMTCRFFQFNAKAFTDRFPRGQRVIVSGAASEWGSAKQMVHPDVDLLGPDEPATPEGLVPVYGEIEGIPPKQLRKLLVDLARAVALKLTDPLPPALREAHALPELGPAVLRAHDPDDDFDASPEVRRRLVFDELFFLQLALAQKRGAEDREPGLAHTPRESWRELAAQLFPFALTNAQERALDELTRDLASSTPMNRLLQGDVGAGKTAVALTAAAYVIAAGRQVALLAPTELLATQHFHTASSAVAPKNLRVALLTGSTRAKDRRAILEHLAAGELDLLIGTHALLEPDVRFKELGLAIIDEQHRFGVEQRAKLRAKHEGGPRPDTLVMTATPIPRTLALTVYGDLRVTVLDELPPGRTPATTRILEAPFHTRELEATLTRALDEGRQAFIVYPLVETSEKIDLAAATDAASELAARYAPRTVGLLHGRMRPDEKAATMDRFVRGELALLVSTTVVEVGVDVPNATVMVVEHAERFGLSQIHQLRGRIGRGAHGGHCMLITHDASAEAKARLAILAATNDGFKVAEHDLATRGPGEVMGTRQSGLPDLVLADLVRDAKVLEAAREEAFRVALHLDDHPSLRTELSRRFGARASLASVG